MLITVYPSHPSTEIDGKIVKLFEQQEFVPVVDAVHGNDFHWLRFNFRCPHRFYCVSAHGHAQVVTVDQLCISPQFAIYFTEGTPVTDFEWDQINLYIKNLVFGEAISDRTQRCIKRLREQVAKPALLRGPEYPDLPQFYEFNSQMFEDRDVAVFEITKANSTTPYTTLVREFSVKGYKPLFTNYFACNAFKNDFVAIQFLMKLWQEFMQGPMDLDAMLKEATEACYPGENYVPIAEPEVYMKSMDEVLEMLGM